MPNPCTGPDCTRPAVSRGLCASHRAQRERGAILAPLAIRMHDSTTVRYPPVRGPSALLERAELEAERRGVSWAQLVRDILSEYLTR